MASISIVSINWVSMIWYLLAFVTIYGLISGDSVNLLHSEICLIRSWVVVYYFPLVLAKYRFLLLRV